MRKEATGREEHGHEHMAEFFLALAKDISFLAFTQLISLLHTWFPDLYSSWRICPPATAVCSFLINGVFSQKTGINLHCENTRLHTSWTCICQKQFLSSFLSFWSYQKFLNADCLYGVKSQRDIFGFFFPFYKNCGELISRTDPFLYVPSKWRMWLEKLIAIHSS